MSTRPRTRARVAAAAVAEAAATAVAGTAASRWAVMAAHPSSPTASRNRGTASRTAAAATVPRLPLHMALPLSKVSLETATTVAGKKKKKIKPGIQRQTGTDNSENDRMATTATQPVCRSVRPEPGTAAA